MCVCVCVCLVKEKGKVNKLMRHVWRQMINEQNEFHQKIIMKSHRRVEILQLQIAIILQKIYEFKPDNNIFLNNSDGKNKKKNDNFHNCVCHS